LEKARQKLMHQNLWEVWAGSVITNVREPRSCLAWVFNFKSGSFTDNTKIAQLANGHFESWKLNPVFVL
jgi:hypothetical protein